MNTHDIELPPLPEWVDWPVTVSEMSASEIKEAMQAYARAAVEADRKSRGEPVAFAKDGNLFWHGDPTAWRGLDGDLYLSPQPTNPLGYITPAAVDLLREGRTVSLCPTDIDNGLPVYLTQPAEPVKVPKATPSQAPTPLSDAYAAVEACHAIKPFLDTVICYASTTSDYEGNRAVKLVEDVCAAFPLTGNAKN